VQSAGDTASAVDSGTGSVPLRRSGSFMPDEEYPTGLPASRRGSALSTLAMESTLLTRIKEVDSSVGGSAIGSTNWSCRDSSKPPTTRGDGDVFQTPETRRDVSKTTTWC